VARHERVIVDLGTGDGRAVLAAGAAEPRSLIIGVDANAASMAEASRRAARSPAKGGVPNALFVVAAAEALPSELAGLADEVRILFPWGSLLHGVLGLDDRAAAGIASLPRSGATISAILSITDRDGIDGLRAIDRASLERLARAHGGRGLELASAREASVDEVLATRSTWGRRLLAGATDRPVWQLDFAREPASDGRNRDLRYDRSNGAPDRRVNLARDTMHPNHPRRPGARPIRGDRSGRAGR
jgi:16S rRNA (adenine(1408)-N(1))-methyltransferase